MTIRRKVDLIPAAPVSPEFRAACHAMVDRLLDQHPGVDAALFVGCWEKGHAVASEPTAFRVKAGIIDGVFAELHPEIME